MAGAVDTGAPYSAVWIDGAFGFVSVAAVVFAFFPIGAFAIILADTGLIATGKGMALFTVGAGAVGAGLEANTAGSPLL